jgi:hypothetical protein
MLKTILKTINENTSQTTGNDGRFHTVYFIEFETGHFYIGKHTSDNLLKDNYFCSGVLANSMKDKGFKYKRKILFYLNTSEEAIRIETEILSDKKIYEHDLCLNCYPGSPPDLTGTIIISMGNKFKMINPKLLNLYLEEGWEQKGVKRIWVSKEYESKFILPDEFDSYLALGWQLGNILSKDRIFIIKGTERKYIKKSFLKEFESNGWEYKHNVTGTKVLRKGDSIIKVQPENVDIKIHEGYKPSSTVEGLIYIVKGKEYKRVHEFEVLNYLNNGWHRGNNATGTIYINDGGSERRVYEDEIHLYPDYKIGRLKKIYLNNGIKERRLSITNVDKIDFYLSQGYSHGKLQRQKKMMIYLGNKKKQIYLDELSSYLQLGWTNIFNSDIHYHPRLKNRNQKCES